MTDEPQDDPVQDFLGMPIETGALVVYASVVGRSARLTLAEVMSVKYLPNEYNKYRIKVQPLEDSFGQRYSNRKYDKDLKKFVRKGESRPVTLLHRDRIMVIT